MNKLRILHIIDYIYPILGYQETFLAKAHSIDNETLVITSDRYSKSIYYANKNLLKKQIVGTGFFFEPGLRILRLPVKFNIALFDRPWLIGLEKAVLGFQPDLIIAHGLINFTSIRIAMLARKLRKSSLIFDDHMTYNASRWGWITLFYKLFKIAFAPIFLKTSKAFVAVTPETKKFMNEMYGIPNERIIVIPLGVDKDNFCKDLNSRNYIRKKYGIRDDDIVFIYAGKIIRQKGVHLLVQAALRISNYNDKVRFMIVGGNDPSYLTTLKAKIKSVNKEDLFVFADAIPNKELYKYFNAADVGVWPLQCSMTMLEATACGLPIVISDKCGAPERAQSGNGLLYKESDIVDLARNMTLLLDVKRRERMSKKAIAYAKTLYWEKIAFQFLALSKH